MNELGTDERRLFSAPVKVKNKLFPFVIDFFSENDFHRVNMKRLSEISGVSTATIYKYFHSKEDLIFAVLEEHIKEVSEKQKLHIQGLESTREKFRKLFWVLMDHYEKNPGLPILFFITIPTGTWMERESWALPEIDTFMRAIIKNGKSKGDIDPIISESHIIGLFFMYCSHEVQIWYYRKCKWNLVDAIDRFFPIFWKTISNPSCSR
jgi:AcrR family transcriptional regulator